MAKNDIENKILELKLEKLKIKRERATLALNKGLLIYFIFLFVAVFGFVNGYVKVKYLNILIVMGFIVLIVGVIPYIKVSREEEKQLDALMKQLKKRLKDE